MGNWREGEEGGEREGKEEYMYRVKYANAAKRIREIYVNEFTHMCKISQPGSLSCGSGHP